MMEQNVETTQEAIDPTTVDEETLSLLLYGEVQAGNISQEIFQANLAMVQSNPGFRDVLVQMKGDDKLKFMYSSLMAQGPEAALAVVGLLVNSGAVSKQQVRSVTGIKKAAKTTKPWFKLVAGPMCEQMYQAAQDWYAENLEDNRKAHGQVVPENIHDFFRQVGKSTLSVGVDKMTHTDSGQDCSLAVVFRIDHNSSARNGTKKTEEGDDDTNGV